MWNKHLQEKAVMSHNSLSAHHCHPPKEKAQEFGLSFQQFFSKTHTRTHFAPNFVRSFKSNQVVVEKIYLLYYSLNIFYHDRSHISFTCGSSLWSWQSIGKLHQNCRQRDNETTPLLEGVPAQKRKRMFHCCQILVQLGKGGLQRAF